MVYWADLKKTVEEDISTAWRFKICAQGELFDQGRESVVLGLVEENPDCLGVRPWTVPTSWCRAWQTSISQEVQNDPEMHWVTVDEYGSSLIFQAGNSARQEGGEKGVRDDSQSCPKKMFSGLVTKAIFLQLSTPFFTT